MDQVDISAQSLYSESGAQYENLGTLLLSGTNASISGKFSDIQLLKFVGEDLHLLESAEFKGIDRLLVEAKARAKIAAILSANSGDIKVENGDLLLDEQGSLDFNDNLNISAKNFEIGGKVNTSKLKVDARNILSTTKSRISTQEANLKTLTAKLSGIIRSVKFDIQADGSLSFDKSSELDVKRGHVKAGKKISLDGKIRAQLINLVAEDIEQLESGLLDVEEKALVEGSLKTKISGILRGDAVFQFQGNEVYLAPTEQERARKIAVIAASKATFGTPIKARDFYVKTKRLSQLSDLDLENAKIEALEADIFGLIKSKNLFIDSQGTVGIHPTGSLEVDHRLKLRANSLQQLGNVKADQMFAEVVNGLLSGNTEANNAEFNAEKDLTVNGKLKASTLKGDINGQLKLEKGSETEINHGDLTAQSLIADGAMSASGLLKLQIKQQARVNGAIRAKVAQIFADDFEILTQGKVEADEKLEAWIRIKAKVSGLLNSDGILKIEGGELQIDESGLLTAEDTMALKGKSLKNAGEISGQSSIGLDYSSGIIQNSGNITARTQLAIKGSEQQEVEDLGVMEAGGIAYEGHFDSQQVHKVLSGDSKLKTKNIGLKTIKDIAVESDLDTTDFDSVALEAESFTQKQNTSMKSNTLGVKTNKQTAFEKGAINQSKEGSFHAGTKFTLDQGSAVVADVQLETIGEEEIRIGEDLSGEDARDYNAPVIGAPKYKMEGGKADLYAAKVYGDVTATVEEFNTHNLVYEDKEKKSSKDLFGKTETEITQEREHRTSFHGATTIKAKRGTIQNTDFAGDVHLEGVERKEIALKVHKKTKRTGLRKIPGGISPREAINGLMKTSLKVVATSSGLTIDPALRKTLFKEIDKCEISAEQANLILSVAVNTAGNYVLPGIGGTLGQMMLDTLSTGELRSHQEYLKMMAADLITQGAGSGVNSFANSAGLGAVSKGALKNVMSNATRTLTQSAFSGRSPSTRELAQQMAISALTGGISEGIEADPNFDAKSFLDKAGKQAFVSQIELVLQKGAKGEPIKLSDLRNGALEAILSAATEDAVMGVLEKIEPASYNIFEKFEQALEKGKYEDQAAEELIKDVLSNSDEEIDFESVMDKVGEDLDAMIDAELRDEFQQNQEAGKDQELDLDLDYLAELTYNQDLDPDMQEQIVQPVSLDTDQQGPQDPVYTCDVDEDLDTDYDNQQSEPMHEQDNPSQTEEPEPKGWIEQFLEFGGSEDQDYCFREDTLVATEEGPKPIPDIKVGDRVLSCKFEEHPGLYSDAVNLKNCDYEEVLKTFERRVEHYWKVFTESGHIEVTGNHEFFVPGIGYQSIESIYTEFYTKDIPVYFFTPDGGRSKVVHLKRVNDPSFVYNIMVRNHRTYFVSQVRQPESDLDSKQWMLNPNEWVLSHNCGNHLDLRGTEAYGEGARKALSGVVDPFSALDAAASYLPDGDGKSVVRSLIKVGGTIYMVSGGIATGKLVYQGGKWIAKSVGKNAPKLLEGIGNGTAKLIGKIEKTPIGKHLVPKYKFHVVEPNGRYRASVGNSNAGARIPSKPNAYSTVYEMKLKETSYPGTSRARHFQEANENLLRQMENDSTFKKVVEDMGVKLERTPTGLAPRKPPEGFTWHHERESGLMRLVPRSQHTPGSSYWKVLHPDGKVCCHPGNLTTLQSFPI